MSDEFDFSTGMPSAEMAQYLQLYLDETAEQMDALVESLLVLETNPTDAAQLNESFRLIHSIKGSSAMMGLDGVTVLTHHLENHFERLRSGLTQLDQASMGLILRCIDFLRECNRRLRAGEPLGSAPRLLEELNALSMDGPSASPAATDETIADADDAPPSSTGSRAGEYVSRIETEAADFPATSPATPESRSYRVLVQFEAGLPLADLKAELVLTRLSAVASERDTRPPRSEFATVSEWRCLEVLLTSNRSPDELRSAANVDGVELIEVDEGATTFAMPAASAAAALPKEPAPAETAPTEPVPEIETAPPGEPAHFQAAPESSEGKSQVAETVRVDIARLDNLMNLAGELVVNKARFVQIARLMSPVFKKSNLSGRARAFGESMRRTVQLMQVRARNGAADTPINWSEHLRDLESELAALEEQSQLWEDGRRGFTQITEAIDQMARVSDSLQRGVLDTRMVPVAPLFNRFKRVVRDIALELDKKVHLEIRGEKTELDKRMIDELGDPLVHLVRNAIDHGIESADVRARRGKPETGTISLEASHSGNNVFITIRDDGGGINVDKVRRRIVERGLLSEPAAEALDERDVIEYIWHPGFSTADTVSDISGRGVGMDIVKTRIAELNGTVDVQHAPGRGTTFTVRLPLTLAIIRSLLFRVRCGVFGVPIDNVREIVSVPVDEIVTVHGRQTFDVRGSFIPLVGIDDIFDWHAVDYRNAPVEEDAAGIDRRRLNVIILHSADKTMGLKVDELHGGQEIVIKSLAENFVHIRGLSGASILGDGSVCLLLDAAAAISLAADPRRQRPRPQPEPVPIPRMAF